MASLLSLSFVMILLTSFAYSKPLKHSSKKLPDKCTGINCVETYELATATHIYDLPGNGYGTSPPTSQPSQDEEDHTEVFLRNMTVSLEKQLENMTSQMSIFFSDVIYLLENQLKILNNRLPQSPARDCQDLARQGVVTSGPYQIAPEDGLGSFAVYCDMKTDGGGWTVFQRRFDGALSFYRGWDEYVEGFGNADGEYWAGLQQIRRLTKTGNWTLCIELEDFAEKTAFAEYDSFRLGDATTHYQLQFGDYRGTAGNSLSYHRNFPFTTKDRDHDKCRKSCSSYNGTCAAKYHGAWWYKSCHRSNLNGKYLGPTGNSHAGMVWQRWKKDQSLKATQMKIRCNSNH